jgi:hypothetical protein
MRSVSCCKPSCERGRGPPDRAAHMVDDSRSNGPSPRAGTARAPGLPETARLQPLPSARLRGFQRLPDTLKVRSKQAAIRSSLLSLW